MLHEKVETNLQSKNNCNTLRYHFLPTQQSLAVDLYKITWLIKFGPFWNSRSVTKKTLQRECDLMRFKHFLQMFKWNKRLWGSMIIKRANLPKREVWLVCCLISSGVTLQTFESHYGIVSTNWYIYILTNLSWVNNHPWQGLSSQTIHLTFTPFSR